jgi:hypothetical protein
MGDATRIKGITTRSHFTDIIGALEKVPTMHMSDATRKAWLEAKREAWLALEAFDANKVES